MKFHIGTSGWRYKHWEDGVFYPPSVINKLTYLSEHLNAVEINSSFYRIPKPDTVAEWAKQVPSKFKIVMKVPRSVSHHRWLKLDSIPPVRNGRDILAYFIEGVLRIPEANRGPVLLQIPERMHLVLERLESILDIFLNVGITVAFEPRHKTWNCMEVNKLLSTHNSALVYSDWSSYQTPLIQTANWLYFRRHGPNPKQMYTGNYSVKMLSTDVELMTAFSRKCRESYVFFNNDGQGFAPKNAMTMMSLIKKQFPRSL